LLSRGSELCHIGAQRAPGSVLKTFRSWANGKFLGASAASPQGERSEPCLPTPTPPAPRGHRDPPGIPRTPRSSGAWTRRPVPSRPPPPGAGFAPGTARASPRPPPPPVSPRAVRARPVPVVAGWSGPPASHARTRATQTHTLGRAARWLGPREHSSEQAVACAHTASACQSRRPVSQPVSSLLVPVS
jgi:hypothetical protein